MSSWFLFLSCSLVSFVQTWLTCPFACLTSYPTCFIETSLPGLTAILSVCSTDVVLELDTPPDPPNYRPTFSDKPTEMAACLESVNVSVLLSVAFISFSCIFDVPLSHFARVFWTLFTSTTFYPSLFLCSAALLCLPWYAEWIIFILLSKFILFL